MHSDEARRFGLNDRNLVEVEIESTPRTTVFGDVVIRSSPDFRLEMPIDTDEANAASVPRGGERELIATSCHATVTTRRPASARGCAAQKMADKP